MTDPSCIAPDCGRVVVTRGYCEAHYSRVKRRGVPYLECITCKEKVYKVGGMYKYCSDACRPKCNREKCDRLAESGGFCMSHYLLFRRHGKPEGAYECVPPGDEYVCTLCGATFPPNGISRKFCTKKCAALFSRYGKDLPSLDFTCIKCGKDVKRDWFEGRFQKSNKSVCKSCTPHPNNSGWYSAFYKSDEGKSGICKLCGEYVDMEIKWPAPMSKSIDHIIPVSKGGGDELENLQLTHLVCNQRRQAKAVEVIALEP